MRRFLIPLTLLLTTAAFKPEADAGERWASILYQGSVSTVVTMTMTGLASTACGVPASALGVAPGVAGAVVCGSIATYYGPSVSEWLILTVTPDEQLDEVAITAGNLLGSVLGAYGAAKAVGRLWLGDFAAYSRSVRLMTGRTYLAARHRIDPEGLRGLLGGMDLDHTLSVGCGYLLGVPASIMAGEWNLTLMPSSLNRSLGSACR
jgi:hypothetical protein